MLRSTAAAVVGAGRAGWGPGGAVNPTPAARHPLLSRTTLRQMAQEAAKEGGEAAKGGWFKV